MPILLHQHHWPFLTHGRDARAPFSISLAFFLSAASVPAGDILRGGAAANVRQSDPSAGASIAAQQQARASQQDALSKTAQSLNAFRAMQAQARAIATGSGANNAGADPNYPGQLLPNVPNGLGPGALQLQGVPTGALTPVQSQAGALTNVTIKQTAQQAFLNWETFNVGRDTSLTFDQSAGGSNVSQWIAFNRITDPSGRPSQILGRINADGQVYLINQNGIIFGGTSQINTRSLVASSLPINDNLIQRGLLNNPDSQFLFSALPIAAGGKGTPAFTPPSSVLPDNRRGDVTIQAGAVISSPVSADGNGGRIFLAGPNITNAGSLLAPNGQVILAAGLEVGVTAHLSSDASLRGLDVYTGSAGTYGGNLNQSGIIEIPRGSASLSGKVINHTGAIESSTSVSLNGRIDITASYDAVPNARYNPADPGTGSPFLFQSTGQVNLGPGSLLRILPETASAEKAVGTQLALRSRINLKGKTIHLGADARILAPNALVSLGAGNWYYNPAINPPSIFVTTGGQVYLDEGAAINVAGSTGVSAPLSQVILSLVLRSGELSPAPLQRTGLLRGPTLTVDLRNTGIYQGRRWVGTPLADLTGYPGLVERTAGELTLAGGTVDISSGGSVVLQRGSSINVSGGHIEYPGGTVRTSRIWVDGHLIDIKDATPDRVYGGLFTGTSDEIHPRWGVTNTYNLPLAPTGEHDEPLTLSGADAGAITLTAPSQALDGVLTGLTSPGPRQLRATSNTSAMPRAGSLSLKFEGQELFNSVLTTNFPAPPDITFGHASQGSPGSFSLDAAGNPALLEADRIRRVILSPGLTTTHGFLNLTVENQGGNITVPEGITLQGRPGASFRFVGSNIGIFGNVIAPGGTIAFEALNLTSYETQRITLLNPNDPRLPPPNANRGIFTLGSGATLSAAGLLVDDRLNASAPFSKPARKQGGTISLKGYAADLAEGSVVDVSGGVLIDPYGHLTYGNGGTIEIEAGQDPQLDGLLGGKLHLGATLLGYSGATAGSLSLTAPLLQIGGRAQHPDTLLLQPQFFSTGGFGRFNLTGLGVKDATGQTIPAVYLSPGTRLEPVARSLVAVPNPQGGGLATRIVDAPVGIRTPVTLGFNAPGVQDGIAGGPLIRGDVVFGQGSLIRTDPLGSVSLSGDTVAVLGSVFAPGGQISLSASRNSSSVFLDDTAARTTVLLGPQARLSAAGTTLLLPDAYGRRIGSVLPGGSISVSGNLLAAAGAIVDVSGTSGQLDLHPATVRPLLTYSIPPRSGLTEGLASLAVERTRVDSSGGSISLSGGQFLYSDATLAGRAGGPTALGGTLSISSGRFYPPNTIAPPTDINLVVRQSGSVFPAGFAWSGIPIGETVPGAISRGYFAADTFSHGGFDSLTLGGTVGFEGPVSLAGRGFLRVASGGVISANDTVSLTAPYVVLGRAFTAPVRPEELVSSYAAAFAPTSGAVRLMVTASQIDIGSLSLQGISQAVLTARNGDIRGNGTFNIAGDLTLRAGQIYPTTASPLNLIAYDYTLAGQSRQGSIAIEASGARDLTLSGGGALGIYASRIRQDGVLRAPLGNIALGWDGTGTAPRDIIAGNTIAFPVTQELTLGAGSITSVSAVDPRTGQGIRIPYGVSPDGLTWIDPRGVDITAGGLPEKNISISGQNVTFAPGATIDLRGGGDLFAYRFVEGNGGPEDILASDNSFAVLPGFASDFAPDSPFNSLPNATNLIREYGPGYVNSHLHAGDRIFLQGSKTLPAGYYTLLPARYALLPGGVLVTPEARQPTGTWELPDGSSLVSGFAFNSLNQGRRLPTTATQYELASGNVIRARAEYETYLASNFLSAAASRLNLAAPLLPRDSGSLIFQGTQSLILQGQVLAPSIAGGRGSRIDLSSALDFVINRNGESATPGTVALGAGLLGSWSAESLLIGGRRSTDASGNPLLTVNTSNITVDNAGVPLRAADLILASNGNITLAPGAALASSGTLTDAPDYLINGNGSLIRVSSDAGAEVVRRGVSASTASLTIGAGAELSGGSITLDSTNATFLDPAAQLTSGSYAINSGRISLVLDQPGVLNASPGLVLTGPAFTNLQAAQSLTLRSYSSIDLYGSGQVGSSGLQRLALSAGEIRGVNGGAKTINFTAGEILLGNATGAAGGVAAPPGSPLDFTAAFNAGIIRLTAGDLAFNNLGQVLLNAGTGVIGEGTGRVGAQGSLTVNTPLVTGVAGSVRNLTAGGILTLAGTGSPGSSGLTPGLGAALNLGGQQTSIGTSVILPSGSMGVTATSGNLAISGRLDVSGQVRNFYDVSRFTDAGNIRLTSTAGDLTLAPSSVVSVAAQAGGGNGGSLTVSNPLGVFTSGGTLLGTAGAGGTAGNFSLDTRALASTAALSQALTNAGLIQTQAIRVRTGDVLIDGTASARAFSLAADAGSINVTGRINASGTTGGSIHLAANGSLALTSSSVLTAAGQTFDYAGKGGQITLEAGTTRDGIVGTGNLDLQTGATIDLSVASNIAGNPNAPGSSAWLGQFTGKLHLRAPQNAAGTDLFINTLNSSILGASSITAEGYKLYDLTASGGTLSTTVQNQIRTDGIAFLGAAGTTTANYTAMTNRLLANNAGPGSVFVLAPGAEVINRTGNLTLGTSSSTTLNDWNLAGNRFGAKSAAGVLTLRAAGDLVFNNTLSDGFTPFTTGAVPPAANLQLWLGRLTAQNPLLPVNNQSYSYRLTAGADPAASNFTAVRNAGTTTTGSLILGKAGTSVSAQNNTAAGGSNAVTSSVIPERWQVIRTGSGDITVATAAHIQLLNHFATIYSAGTSVADRTMGGTFDAPLPGQTPGSITELGANQLATPYPSQYSRGGGNVSLTAGGNIEHLTRNAQGQLVADSQLQLPNNWLYRRGTIDPVTGQFAIGRNGTEQLSTSWWVDFNNFFQGIGALGGGNVSLTAGGNISNVDAVAPTNLRLTKGTPANPLPANQTALELGGGDVTIRSGGNIDGGIYYVERGEGILNAGGSIITNATRSVPVSGTVSPETNLPTTLFAGRSNFTVSARGSVLLGPVANAFLLPEGLGNSIFYRSYFSSFSLSAKVAVSALGGDVSLRTAATLPAGGSAADPVALLSLWAGEKQFVSSSAATLRPWLRLNELTGGEAGRFTTTASIQPGTLEATSYSGNINLAGNLTLAPSPTGTLSLLAAVAVNALQPTGQPTIIGLRTNVWSTSRINVSDADPGRLPSVPSPLGYLNSQSGSQLPLFFESFNQLFSETGSTSGNIQTKQALHAPGPLHANDNTPLRVYAGTGDISGLTLFSPKFSRIFAGRDLTDVSLYLQNVRAGDASIVTSARDIVPANAGSALRVPANRQGNIPSSSSGPLAGDIQIAGPGSLQVLAGRNLDLGTVAGNADGTGVGLTSIGNARNPYLGFAGANLIAGAGIGVSTGLGGSTLDFDSFIASYVKGPKGESYLTELSTRLDGRSFDSLTDEEQKQIALEVFFLVLRDAGRSKAGAATDCTTGGGYADGFAAIASLFPGSSAGEILTRGRDIRTRNGGDISLFAPGGGLTLANTIIGNPLAPPGIVTESGGNIGIFTNNDVNVGVGRIFTLRGGNQIIWSSTGDIAAGSSAKTVQSAPPTRVLIDPQSGAVQTDLAGLATGGGIGVLATVAGVPPGNVDLIAPAGVVDAGDAGIRSSGNLTIAATQVLNAGNIAVSGSSTGTPAAPVVSTPNIGGLAAASNTAGAGNAAATSAATPNQPAATPVQTLPSIINVEVLGYGGGEGPAAGGSQEDEDEETRRKRAREAAQ